MNMVIFEPVFCPQPAKTPSDDSVATSPRHVSQATSVHVCTYPLQGIFLEKMSSEDSTPGGVVIFPQNGDYMREMRTLRHARKTVFGENELGRYNSRRHMISCHKMATGTPQERRVFGENELGRYNSFLPQNGNYAKGAP